MRTLLLVATIGVLLVPAARASADAPPLDGAWTMTAVSESFTVQQWSAACGPAPASGTLVAGGPVTLSSAGGELAVSGARRPLRSDRCLDPLPTLGVSTHSHDAKQWRTTCATPQGDPRRATLNSAWFAVNDDAISVAETGRYEFAIGDSKCIADVRRGANLARVKPAAPVDSSTPTATATARPKTPPAATTPAVDCSTPGDPVRLEARPSRKLLKMGDTFVFRAAVLDASGCPTPTPIAWSVGAVTFKDDQAHAAQPSIDSGGKLTVPPSGFADAAFDVVATAGGKSARAAVHVTSAAKYEELLAQSGLDPNGERDEPSVAMLATESIGGGSARVDSGARTRKMAFVAVIVSLALMFGAVAIVGARRARKARAAEQAAEDRHAERMREFEAHKREREEQHAAQMRAHLESVAVAQKAAASAAARGLDSGPMYCPSCRREFPPGSTFCPQDANRLLAVSGNADIIAGPAGGICPSCRRGFNPGVKVCPDHREELLPLAMLSTRATAGPPDSRGKICPTCGGRFEGSAAFCGKDGTQLVLVN